MNSFLESWLIGTIIGAAKEKISIEEAFQNQYDNIFRREPEPIFVRRRNNGRITPSTNHKNEYSTGKNVEPYRYQW